MMSTEWISYHLFYHGDLDRLLRELVRPTVVSWIASSHIDRFFFLRYGLGGPHVRLRIRARQRQRQHLADTLKAAADEFFARWPSTASLTPADIRRNNRAFLANDPDTDPEQSYADNSLHEIPFRPETERYGGAALLDASLELFTIDSVSNLVWLDDHREASSGRRLGAALGRWIEGAWGLAANTEELLSLFGYGMQGWGKAQPEIVRHGDRVFAQQGPFYTSLVRRRLDELMAHTAAAALPVTAEAARRLAWTIRAADVAGRRRIAISQLHMAANRLGLGNPEEVYLSRLLTRAGNELTAEQSFWNGIEDALHAKATAAVEPLSKLLTPAFLTLG